MVDEKVFNATLVMYFLDNYNEFNKIPDELFDSNIIENYTKIDNIIKLKGNNVYKKKYLIIEK